MSHREKKDEVLNPNWEAEIAEYDSACESVDREFMSHHLLVPESGRSELTIEENEVFNCVLRGLPADEIAEMYGVEIGLVTGLVEVIRAKLSLTE